MIAKDERATVLAEDEVVLFAQREIRGLHRQFARHAEVDTEPGIAAKAEEHLFCRGGRGKQRGAGETVFEQGAVAAAKNRRGRVKEHALDFLLQAWIPALADEFNFGEFGHGKRKQS
jgi:hypothetical protein